MPQAALLQALSALVDSDTMDWLSRSCELRGERLLAAFVGAGRRLPATQLPPDCQLPCADGPVPCSHWSATLAGRVALLLSSSRWSESEAQSWILRCYREGDSREKSAVVAALPLLPFFDDLVELALDAGRTNEADFFELLALRNPFPAGHYGELEFNKLVMKAAFAGLDLALVMGLEERHNPELARMGMEYIDERQAAGRDYPPSLWLAIAPEMPAGALARMLGELQHSVPARRLGAATALGISGETRSIPFLQERGSMEKHEPTARAITDALSRLEDLQ